MLKRKLCEARIEWTLRCPGPLLIADRRYDPAKLSDTRGRHPDKVFISHAHPDTLYQAVRTRPAMDLDLPFYVPGTSVRGPFRAQAERIIRSLLPGNATPPATACDPFETRADASKSCSRRLEESPVRFPYSAVCPACKLFGCVHAAGRIQFTDAAVSKGFASVYRDMVGIDRFSGGVFKREKDERRSGGANMRLHVLENAAFTTITTVVNFELWQLGLLAYVFRDFEQGLVSIGFGKSRGFGLVTGKAASVVLTYPSGEAPGRIHHLGSLAAEGEISNYGLHRAEAPEFGLVRDAAGGLTPGQSFSVPDSSIAAFWETVAKAFDRYIDGMKEAAA